MPRVYASLNKRGEIALSAEAFRHLGGTWYVALDYDTVRRTIRIRSRVAGEDIYYVREYGRGRRMCVISAVRLLKRFDIKIEQTLIFDEPEVTRFYGVAMLVLELDKAENKSPPVR